jgi:outer membrane lipoprotein SlyB
MDTPKRTLHPLLQAAAVSLIVFSAVGVAAITGFIPTSKGSAKDETPVAAAQAPVATAQAPIMAAEAPPQTQTLPDPKPAPAKKPAKKRAVHSAPKMLPAPAPAPAPTPATVTYEPVAQAPQAVEEPKPVVKPGQLGYVESVREVVQDGDAKGIGAVAGGVVGAVLGHQLKHDSKLVTLVGGAAGAFIGNEAEKRQRATRHWELTVRLDDGTIQKVRSDAAPFWHQGDRVRLLDGKLVPA